MFKIAAQTLGADQLQTMSERKAEANEQMIEVYRVFAKVWSGYTKFLRS